MENNEIWNYIERLYNGIPSYVYILCALIFLVGTIASLLIVGYKKSGRLCAIILTIEYVLLLLSSTVIFRPVQRVGKSNFIPFWSYWAIHEGKNELLTENILNVALFIPLGILLSLTSDRIKWWVVLLIGCAVSVIIELSQFIWKKGFSEFDDVFHNMVGCMLGLGLVKLMKSLYGWFSQRRVAVL